MKSPKVLLMLLLFFTLFSQDKYIGSITFYSPSDLEIEKLMVEENEGFNESYSDFMYYKEKVKKFMKDHKIRIIENKNQIVKISNTFEFNRIEEKVNFGFILSKSNEEPKLFKNIYTDIGISCAAKKYFKLNFKSAACPN